ncbi:MAG: hypothetical protein M0Q38_04450 [Bacteroidales bacterium]|jgi:hypothetical protein|nr:hypothetical protein [Bacteroidales bacterium]
MKKICYGIVLTLVIFVAGIKCAAQDDGRSLLKQVIKENQEAVYAIAMYPTETRKIIFEATEYPEVIAKLTAMQKNSQDAFEKLISSFSKEEQEKIWNLTRYDGLISDLAADHKKAEDEINNILVNYPEEIHKTASEEEKNHYELLVQLDKMNQNYNSDFELLLSDYTPEVIKTFREMIKMPEVLDILFDHMQYTVVVGDYYKKNPERVLHKTDSLNLVLTQKNAQEANDWKQSMSENPQAQKEYTQAAKEYAQENGYQPEDYNAPLTQDVTNYNTNPYNWWFGYPSWYPYDYWNPYPYWYDWGFYYGPGGQIVFFGLPSSYFMDWYFYYPKHCSQYAELSNHYYNYYNRHRESMNNNSISHGVNLWRVRNKDLVTEDWDNDNPNRVQRFKEYGKMEIDRQKYNIKNPRKSMEQTEYIQKQQRKYPLLSEDVSNRQVVQTDSRTKPVQEKIPEPVKKPAVTVPVRFKAPTNEQIINKQPEQNIQQRNGNIQNDNIIRQQPQETPTPQPSNANPKNQTEKVNQVRDAQQYHQNTWEEKQPQPVRQSQQQIPTPAPRQQESKQVTQPVRQNPAPAPRQQENQQVTQPVKQNTQTPTNTTKRK